MVRPRQAWLWLAAVVMVGVSAGVAAAHPPGYGSRSLYGPSYHSVHRHSYSRSYSHYRPTPYPRVTYPRVVYPPVVYPPVIYSPSIYSRSYYTSPYGTSFYYSRSYGYGYGRPGVSFGISF